MRFSANCEPSVFADRTRIAQVVSNLLTNALQYTPENGAVRIQLRNDDAFVIIAVRDNGLGFSRAEMDKVGDAFARFDRPGATTGTGLGLAICTALARRMHGAVELEGIQGEGTVAALKLPRA